MTGIEGVGRPAAPRAASRAADEVGVLRAARDRRHGPGDRRRGAACDLARLDADACRSWAARPSQDREARRHGHDMLAALAELQRALLGGRRRRGGVAAPGGAGGRGAAGDRSGGWPPWSRRSSCGRGWSWRAGSLSEQLRVSLLKLAHAPLAELSAIAISPRNCDPGRAGGFRGFRQAQGGSAARGKAGPARHDDHPTPRLPTGRG